jgi:hypothetical protein
MPEKITSIDGNEIRIGRLRRFEFPGDDYTSLMATNLDLSALSLREKLDLMEALWENLSRDPSSIESPDWHGDVLTDRGRRVAEGRARFLDWESVKSEFRPSQS